MPVVSTATSVTISPIVTGQRGYLQKPYNFDERQRVWINIQDTSVTINVLETLEINTYTIGQLTVDSYSTGTSGFSTSTTITVSAPDDVAGTQLVAEPVIENSCIVGINVITTGTGYAYTPTFTITDPENPSNTNSNILIFAQHDLESGVPVTHTFLRGTITIPLALFKTHPNLENQTLWAFETEFITIEQNKNPELKTVDLRNFPYLNRPLLQPMDRKFNLWVFKRPYPVLNKTAIFKGTDLDGPDAMIGGTQQPLFYFFVHDKNFTSWNQVSWRFNYGTETADPFLIGPSAATFKESTDDVTDITTLFEEIYLKIPDEAITAGTPVPVEVHTSPFVDYVYVEQVCGIPDRTKVSLVDGVGKFNILTTTLEAGDVASAKVGFKYWVNVETVEKTLS